MNFYKNNAYPEIFLHDCECKINYDNEKQILQFVFDVGFCLKDDGKGNIERKPGIIQISNLPLDEITIKIFKFRNFLGHFKIIGKYCELSNCHKLFKGYQFRVVDEYYAYQTLLLRGTPYPYSPKHKIDEIEIEIYLGESSIEYHFI